MADTFEGRVIDGRIEIGRLIARGGGGAVYEATHKMLKRRVALKLVEADDPTARDRIRSEARAIARIRSAHVVALTDFGFDEAIQMPYLAMELVDGQPLTELPRPMAWREAAELGVQLLAGIEAAHAAGVVHRDLKPSNVVIARRQDGARLLKVLDFGVSRLLWQDARTTRTGELVGTPAYMAPEQITADEIDGRADLWAVGVLLYELIAGRRPFDAEEPVAVFRQILRDEPPPLDEVVRSAAPIAPLVRRVLTKDREQRPSSAAELGAELKALLAAPPAALRAGRTVAAPRQPAAPPSATDQVSAPVEPVPTRRPAPHPAVARVITGLVLAGVLLVAFLAIRPPSTPDPVLDTLHLAVASAQPPQLPTAVAALLAPYEDLVPTIEGGVLTRLSTGDRYLVQGRTLTIVAVEASDAEATIFSAQMQAGDMQPYPARIYQYGPLIVLRVGWDRSVYLGRRTEDTLVLWLLEQPYRGSDERTLRQQPVIARRRSAR